MPQTAIAQSSIGAQPWRAPRGAAQPSPAIETARLALRAGAPDGAGDVVLTILPKPGLKAAGWIRFRLVDEALRVAELSFFLDPAYRGRGLMREAARAAAPQALRLLGARVLRARLPVDAPAAADGVARSLGLVPLPARGGTRCFEKDLCGLI